MYDWYRLVLDLVDDNLSDIRLFKYVSVPKEKEIASLLQTFSSASTGHGTEDEVPKSAARRDARMQAPWSPKERPRSATESR